MLWLTEEVSKVHCVCVCVSGLFSRDLRKVCPGITKLDPIDVRAKQSSILSCALVIATQVLGQLLETHTLGMQNLIGYKNIM